MHYLLFFPGKTSNSAACLRGVGLADFIDGSMERPVTFEKLGTGLLVGWGDGVTLDEPNQRWIACQGYYIGFWKNHDFSPEDIARTMKFPGTPLELNDGHFWTVPAAAHLPENFRLVDGRWQTVRKPQFVDFWNQSEAWFRRVKLFELDPFAMAADAKIELNAFMQQWIEFCIYALRQNYRINSAIASELGILDDVALVGITMSIIEGMNITAVLEEIKEAADKEAAGLKKEVSHGIHGS